MLDLDAAGRFRTGPYAGLTPAEAEPLIRIDLSATALGFLSGPALPFSDVIDVSPTAFQGLSLPASDLALDPTALALTGGRGALPVAAFPAFPEAALGGLMTTILAPDPLAELDRTLTALCGLDAACRARETANINAFVSNVQAVCQGDAACEAQRRAEGAAISQTVAAQCGFNNPACTDPLTTAVARSIETDRIRSLQSITGATPMSAPFDLGFSFLPTPTGSSGQPTGMSMPDSFGGSLLGSIVGALPGLLSSLSQAGVIRGSVGQAFAPMQANPVGMAPAIATNLFPLPPAAGGGVLDQAMRALQALGGVGSGVATIGNLLPGVGGASCGAGVQPVVSAPTLFRTNSCGRSSPVSRVQVMGPNGAIYVFANLGRATRGSNEARVMRRLARDNGFVLGRRGSSARGRRRRPR